MFVRQLKVIALSLAAALLFIVPAASAAPAETGAAAPLQAVQTLVNPFATPGPAGGACNAVSGDVQGCPITPRLLDRLQHPTPAENGNIVSRSQNPPRGIDYKEIDNNGQTAHVNTRWFYGTDTAYNITFVAVKTAVGWQVDDSYCAGMPATSIYNAPVGPCQVLPISFGGGTQTPGMPNTGAASDIVPFLVLAAGMLTMLVGFFLSGYGRASNT